MKLKNLIITIIYLSLFPLAVRAENYRFSELYEISTKEDWRIISKSHADELMKQADAIVNRTKMEVDFNNISTPFMIYKEGANEAFLIRVMVAPPELTREEFENLTVLEINAIGDFLSKRQNEVMRVSGIKLISSQSGLGVFKGVSAIRTESVSYNARGLKVSRAQYIVYRTSATLSISLEHTVRSGEPNYKLIEEKISKFNVLAR